MSSDEARRPADTRFRGPGIGLNPSFLCYSCGKPSQATGSRYVKKRGQVAGKNCKACAKEVAN